MNNAFTVNKDHQHALDVRSDLPCLLDTCRGLLFILWVATLDPDFICYDTREEVTVVLDLCNISWHKILYVIFFINLLFIILYIHDANR